MSAATLYVYADMNLCEVLYIGVSGDADRRDREHRSRSAWRTDATRQFRLKLSRRSVALGMESYLISLYAPRGNTLHAATEPDLLRHLAPETTADDVAALDELVHRMTREFEKAERDGRRLAEGLMPGVLAHGTVGAMVEAARTESLSA